MTAILYALTRMYLFEKIHVVMIFLPYFTKNNNNNNSEPQSYRIKRKYIAHSSKLNLNIISTRINSGPLGVVECAVHG